jgi:hypothetical protein
VSNTAGTRLRHGRNTTSRSGGVPRRLSPRARVRETGRPARSPRPFLQPDIRARGGVPPSSQVTRARARDREARTLSRAFPTAGHQFALGGTTVVSGLARAREIGRPARSPGPAQPDHTSVVEGVPALGSVLTRVREGDRRARSPGPRKEDHASIDRVRRGYGWPHNFGGQNRCCFLADRDLHFIRAFPAHYPFHQLWNGYSPFREIDETTIEALNQLAQLLEPRQQK